MCTISGLPGQGAPDPIVRRVEGGIAQNAGRPASLTNGKDPPFRAIPVGEIGLSRTRRNPQRAFDWLEPAAFLECDLDSLAGSSLVRKRARIPTHEAIQHLKLTLSSMEVRPRRR